MQRDHPNFTGAIRRDRTPKARWISGAIRKNRTGLMSMIQKLLPTNLKSLGRRILRKLGYDLVYYYPPAGHHRYPYADQNSFFEDIKNRGFNPNQVIDIGANKGSWSQEIAEVFPHVRSLLVEPQLEQLPKLRKLCEQHSGWKIASVGVGKKTQMRTFHAQKDTVSSSFSLSEENEAGDTNALELQVLSLKDLVEQYVATPEIDLLKIDAEGLELEIIESAEDIVRSVEIVMLEVSFFEFEQGRPSFAKLVAKMDELGFSIYDFTMFYRRPFDSSLGIMDCVFVSNSSPLRSSDAW